MKVINLLLLLAAAGACIYFYLDDKKTSQAAPSQTAPSQTAPSQTAPSQAAPSLRTMPPVPVCNPSPDSLAGKLENAAAQSPRLKKGNQIHSSLGSYYFSEIQIQKKGLTDLNEAKRLLSQMKKVFEIYRKLNKCTALGVSWSGDPRQTMQYLNNIGTAVSDLLISAEYHLLSGNKKQSLQDIGTALHIIDILCKNATASVDFYTCLYRSREIAAAVKRLKFSAKEKKELLKKLPGRKKYAAVLPFYQEKEKKSMLFMLEWTSEMEYETIQNSVKAQLQKNASAETVEKVRRKVSKEVKEEYEKLRELKKIPVEKLEKIYADCSAFALKGFKENSLNKESKYSAGSSEDDRIAALLEGHTLTFVRSFSVRLDAFEKSIK